MRIAFIAVLVALLVYGHSEATVTEGRPISQLLPAPTQLTEYQPITDTVEPVLPQLTDHRILWLKEAGVPQSEWDAALELYHRESTWNPEAVNPSSGACGLVQALPCEKIPGNWRDPVNALKWGYEYVLSRYGSYSAAIEFHNQNSWY